VKYSALALALLISLAGCGGGSNSGSGGGGGAPGITVQVVSPTPPAAVDDNDGQSVAITVQVSGDSSNKGVTWAIVPEDVHGPTGTLSNTQPLTVTYVPPSGITASVNVNVVATSVADTTRSATLPITIYPPTSLPPSRTRTTPAFRFPS
jgi:hypothetical protein